MSTNSSLTDFLKFPKDKNHGYKGGGNPNEQLEWNKNNQSKVEDEKESIIAPLEQFFN
jgi:hypothetical protein